MNITFRFSARVFKADGTSFPVAAFELETARAVAKHAVSCPDYVKAVVSERVGKSHDWREVFTVYREGSADDSE